MKKLLTLLLTAAVMLSCLTALSFTARAEGVPFYIGIETELGLTLSTNGSESAAIVTDGLTAAADEAISYTAALSGWIATASASNGFSVLVDGAESEDAKISWTFNSAQSMTSYAGYSYTTAESQKTGVMNLFLTLKEGTYKELTVVDNLADGTALTVLVFTNLTITAPVHSLDEDGEEVVPTPVWSMDAEELSGITGGTRCAVTGDDLYATFTATSGDPHVNFFTGTQTKVGRFILIKYNNRTIVPRMQFYIAGAAGIKSDANMLEFEIAADGSGWTYAVVDLAANANWDRETMSVTHFRFDHVEARNWNGGTYAFSGNEAVDVAYVMGFTTRKGLEIWLTDHELHPVTKTALLLDSQVTKNEDGTAFYVDKDGVTRQLTAAEDGKWTCTFETTDVRTPIHAVPVTLLDGSRLLGADGTGHVCTIEKDAKTGIATLTATGADPYYLLTGSPLQAARWMTVTYRTEVEDSMEFFTASEGTGPEGGKSFITKLIADGQWHTALIDLSDKSFIDSETYLLNYLRFDFLCGASEGVMEVECIAFFNTEDEALQYRHEYKVYTVTFTANNQTVAKVTFEAGQKTIDEPAVPVREGYNGVWAAYELSDKNITVRAIYTAVEVPTEPETDPATEPETDPVTEPVTEAPSEAPTEAPSEAPTEPVTEAPTDAPSADTSATDAPAGDETEPGGSSGCASAAGCAALLLTACAACVVMKKRK